jgi:uncharacterized protein YqgC (DUF456 family)
MRLPTLVAIALGLTVGLAVPRPLECRGQGGAAAVEAGDAAAAPGAEPAGRSGWTTYLLATLLVLLNTVWLVLVVLQLPGTWLMVLSAGLLALVRPGMFSVWTLLVVVALATLGEIVEFASGLVGAKTVRATRWGGWGGLIGAIVGAVIGMFAIPVPIVGSLIGACAGAAAGAFLLEFVGAERSLSDAMRSGLGAGVGRLAGAVAKLALGAAIWLILAVAAFWP